MEQLIVLERPADNIVVLTLNRPDKKNALSIALRDAVSDALDTLRQDTSLKCVILLLSTIPLVLSLVSASTSISRNELSST